MFKNNFKSKAPRFGGGDSRPAFKRPSFGKSRGPKRDFDGPKREFNNGPIELHDATCANCHKACQVPFRPNGKKPVYCKDCFASTNVDAPGRTFSRDESSTRPSYAARTERSESAAPQSYDLKLQIDKLSSKVDQLIALVESQSKN